MTRAIRDDSNLHVQDTLRACLVWCDGAFLLPNLVQLVIKSCDGMN